MAEIQKYGAVACRAFPELFERHNLRTFCVECSDVRPSHATCCCSHQKLKGRKSVKLHSKRFNQLCEFQPRKDVLKHYPFIDDDGTMTDVLKGQKKGTCCFVDLVFRERIRLARKVYDEFKGGNVKLQPSDLRESLSALGLQANVQAFQPILGVLPPTLREVVAYPAPDHTLLDCNDAMKGRTAPPGTTPAISLPLFLRVVQALSIDQGASDGPKITAQFYGFEVQPSLSPSEPNWRSLDGETYAPNVERHPNQDGSPPGSPSHYRPAQHQPLPRQRNCRFQQGTKRSTTPGSTGDLGTYGADVRKTGFQVKDPVAPNYLKNVKSKIKPGLDQIRLQQRENRKARELAARSEVAARRLIKHASGEKFERGKTRGAFARDIADSFLDSEIMSYITEDPLTAPDLNDAEILSIGQSGTPASPVPEALPDDYWYSEYEPQTFNINGVENVENPARHSYEQWTDTFKLSHSESKDPNSRYADIGLTESELLNGASPYPWLIQDDAETPVPPSNSSDISRLKKLHAFGDSNCSDDMISSSTHSDFLLMKGHEMIKESDYLTSDDYSHLLYSDKSIDLKYSSIQTSEEHSSFSFPLSFSN